jgi:DNA polymerase-1
MNQIISPYGLQESEPLILNPNDADCSHDATQVYESHLNHKLGDPFAKPSLIIPPEINNLPLPEAARLYPKIFGIPVIPLHSIYSKKAKKPGKQPIHKGFKNLKVSQMIDAYFFKYIPMRSKCNLGGVLQGQLVWVDIDAKNDKGESAVAWLDKHESLKDYPRVRTLNGFHIPIFIPDLPAGPEARIFPINDHLIIEVLVANHLVTLPPSLRLDGVPYLWEITGPIPEMSWSKLLKEFDLPEKRKPGRPRKPCPWHQRFCGDLTTLDLPGLLRTKGMLGECLDEADGKYAVRCPWEHEHSDRHEDIRGDTAIWAKEGSMPGFNCFHAHCAERKIKELVEWFESQDPGVIDRHCSKRRTYGSGESVDDKSKPLIVQPGHSRLISVVAAELAEAIGNKHCWFARHGKIVEVSEDQKTRHLIFKEVTTVAACAGVEQFVTPVVLKQEEAGVIMIPLSFSPRDITPVIGAPQFYGNLPVIDRILSIGLPILIDDGTVAHPQPGYNPDLRTFLRPDAPEIEEMTVAEAKQVIGDIFGDFCFTSRQDKVHAVARLITPFVRGIMGLTARAPLWLHIANRPRAGKDYLAGVIMLLYIGELLEDAPLEKNSEETRKRITAALMSGRQFMHFANCQGHINDAALIGAITARVLRMRNLGSTASEADLELANEIEFSMSANVGVTYREDIEPRTRRIGLEFFDEDPNKRLFRRPDLHAYVRANRGRILGAIKAFVDAWIKQSMPPGITPFTSFPEWARVVGGIMQVNGLGDPCLPHATELEIGGDLRERAMRAVYRIGYAKWPKLWIPKDQLFNALAEADDEDLQWFGPWAGEEGKGTRNKAGMALKAYHKRFLGGVRLSIDENGKGSKQKVMFTTEGGGRPPESGNLGNLGNLKDPGPKADNIVFQTEIPPTFELLTEKCTPKVSQVSKVSMVAYQLVTSASEFPAIAAALASASSVVLDSETHGPGKGDALDPLRGQIRLLQLAVPGEVPWLIDLKATGTDLGPLRDVLESLEVIAHNALFDLGFLREYLGIIPRRVFCTMTASRLLAAGTDDKNDLFACLQRYLEVPGYPDHGGSNWSGALTEEQLAYAAADVAHLHTLRTAIDSEIDRHGLRTVCNIEMDLIPVTASMAAAGLLIDQKELDRQVEHAERSADDAQHNLREISGDLMLNPNSPKQVKAALEAAGLSLPDTKQETLASHMGVPFVVSLLECRQQEKLASMLAGLRKQVDDDGRLRTSFNPLGTCTGRFSSSKPNLQNIPRGAPRTIVKAPSGRRFVRADYGQIELRIAAAMTGEERMLEAFRNGEDLHRLTAAFVTGKSPSAITKQERQEAKAVNFGFLYGQGAEGFRKRARAEYGLDLNLKRAEELRNSFFKAYPALAKWHEEAWRKARQGIRETRTLTGRRRLIPEKATDWNRFTALVNSPVQGLGADGMKRALIRLHLELPSGCSIILTVHDDVLVECPEILADEIKALIERIMCEEMSRLVPEVLIEVEAEILTEWK